jgi:hypothetical protein
MHCVSALEKSGGTKLDDRTPGVVAEIKCAVIQEPR